VKTGQTFGVKHHRGLLKRFINTTNPKEMQIIYRLAQSTLEMAGTEYHAVSGPYGNGPLPPGEYVTSTTLAPNAGHYFPSGFRLDSGTAYGVKLEPQFPTSRGGLWIHPDGNVAGTLGCIGVAPQDAERFWQDWQRLNPSFAPVPVYVEDRTLDLQKVATLPVTRL